MHRQRKGKKKNILDGMEIKRGKTGCMESIQSLKQERVRNSQGNIINKVNKLLEIIDKVNKTKTTSRNKEFPRTVAEAMGRKDWEKWKEAIKKEMISIVK